MNHEMRMPLRKAKNSYSKLLKKMDPYKGFMNKGLIEPGTNQDMGEYEEQMGSDASYMKMNPMHNGKPDVQQDDFEQFKKVTGDDVVGNDRERTNVFEGEKNKDVMGGVKDFYNKNTPENPDKYSKQGKKWLRKSKGLFS